MPTFNEIGPLERARYKRAYFEALNAIDDALDELRRRNASPTISPGERAENDAAILVLERARARLIAERERYRANQSVIHPPSDALIERHKVLNDEVEKLVDGQKATSEILSAATDLLNTFKQVHPSAVA